ncbi:MAG: UPF0489 family protein [Candidatus Delongbacteria bacterium]|nr:UPF0489 family protein [Candidatus Delongbacteria bacterium]
MDLFQSERALHCPSNKNVRLDGNQTHPFIKPWSQEKLDDFLKRCGLCSKNPSKGIYIKNHDEVFFILRKMILNKEIKPVLEIYHADAHADLGCGDASSTYIMNELIQLPAQKRIYPKLRFEENNSKIGDLEGLSEGNYLLFMLACTWIKKLIYIHHKDCFDDIPFTLFPGKVPKKGIIKLPIYNKIQLDSVQNLAVKLIRNNIEAVKYDPEVKFERILNDQFYTDTKFDLIFVCQSPTYTLTKTDELFDIIKKYIFPDKVLSSIL